MSISKLQPAVAANLLEDNFDNVTLIPEPFTILGAGTAFGFGAFFKRKLAQAKNSNKA